MKRYLLLTILFLSSSISFAQTQQGIVKTRGRVVNGKVVAGTRLNGATITLNIGNPLVSGPNGAFSFNVPTGKNYSLVTAKKQGYTLADPEFTRHSFKYSASNPFYVVLEDEAQRQADINAARRNIQNTMSAQLKLKEKELEALKQQKTINEQEYERRIAELYDAQDKSYELVKTMAERYASTDYDQLDEFNQQIQMYIENGELLKADSMIQSKGSLEKRIEEYHQVVAANKEERERLEQSEAGAAKTYADLSQDLYNKAEIAKQQFEWNEVLMLLKQRADLDTTNAKCVSDYADFAFAQKMNKEALHYYEIALRNLQSDEMMINDILHSMAMVYYVSGFFEKAIEINDRVLKFKEKQDLTETKNSLSLARTLNNIANSYWVLKNFTEAERFYLKSTNIYKNHIQSLSLDEKIRYYGGLMNLGNLYRDMIDYQRACICYFEVVDSLSVLCDENSLSNADQVALQSLLAMTYDNIGTSYKMSKDYSKSKEFFEKSYVIYSNFFEVNPNAYKERIASVIEHLGGLYNQKGDYENALEHFLRAEELSKELMPTGGVDFIDMVTRQENIAVAYLNLKQYESAEIYVQKSLDLLRDISAEDVESIRYKAKVAHIQSVCGRIYKETEQYEKAQDIINEAIQTYTFIFKNHFTCWIELVDAINDYGQIYWFQSKYDYAFGQYSKAMDIINTLPNNIKENDIVTVTLKNAQVNANIALMHSLKEDYDTARKYYEVSESAYAELSALDSVSYTSAYAAALLYNTACCCLQGDTISVSKKAQLALRLFENMYSINKGRENSLIYALQQIAGIYNQMNDIPQAVKTYSRLIEIYKNSIHGSSQIPYDMIQAMYELSEVYKNNSHYIEAESVLSEACDYCRKVNEKDIATFRSLYANILWNRLVCVEQIKAEDSLYKAVTREAWEQFAVLYKETPDKYKKVFVFLQCNHAWYLLIDKKTDESLNLLTEIYDLDKDYVADNLAAALNVKAYEYAKIEDYVSATNTINHAISVLPNNHVLYDSKGEILLMQGKNEEALEMWKKVLELNPDFLKNRPKGTELYNGLKKLGLIE